MMLFQNDLEGKRKAKYLTAIKYSIPVILFWIYSVYNFLSGSNNQCFGMMDIIAFLLMPTISMVAYIKAGDKILLNSFRTIGYLMISSWLSLLISFAIAFALLTLNGDSPVGELYHFLLSEEKIINLFAESIFFSIFLFVGAVVIIYTLKNTDYDN